MKNFTNKQIISVLVWIVLVFILCYNLNLNHKAEIAKKDMKIETLLKVAAERIKHAEKPSKVERLTEAAKQFKKEAELDLEKIVTWQEEYEFDLLTSACFQDQANRLMNFKPVDEEYCMNYENLEQYKTKK